MGFLGVGWEKWQRGFLPMPRVAGGQGRQGMVPPSVLVRGLTFPLVRGSAFPLVRGLLSTQVRSSAFVLVRGLASVLVSVL